MLKVGITGGIGCGKSQAVAVFARLGVPIVDADRIAREVVMPGQPALQYIAQMFGDEALNPDQSLNRAWMRAHIFQHAQARERLESILHPAIRRRIIIEVEQAAKKHPAYVMVDIPLLVEKGYQSLFDRIIVVDCLPEQQIQRVMARDGSDAEQIKGIIAVQAERSERLKYATDVLDNTTSMEQLESQILLLHEKLVSLATH